MRTVAVLLLICGICLYFIGGIGQKATKPMSVSVGHVNSSGQYVETNSGGMGGNLEEHNDMQGFKTLGIIAGIAGAVFFLASCAVKEEK